MNNMPGMGKNEQQKTASGTGTVTALDKTAKKITLDHGPISAIGVVAFVVLLWLMIVKPF